MNPYTHYTDFTESRKKGVGASDIPILAGLRAQYEQTPLTLWAEKKGLEESFEGNEKTEWCHRLESLILSRFLDDSLPKDRNIDIPDYCLRKTEFFHPEFKFALCHPDMIITAQDRPIIVEAKSLGYFSGKRDENPDKGYDADDLTENGIPADVFLQIQYQMTVTGIDLCYVAALIDTNDYRTYGPITRNIKIQEQCLALARRFWDCMENNIPPSPQIFKDIQIIFPNPKPLTKIIDGLELAAINTMQKEKQKYDEIIKKNENLIEDIKKAMGLICAGHEVLSDPTGNTLATYKMPKPKQSIIKLSTIKKEHPDALAYLTENKLIKESDPKPSLLIKKFKTED